MKNAAYRLFDSLADDADIFFFFHYKEKKTKQKMSTVPHLFTLLCVCAEKHNNKYTGLEFTYAEAELTKRERGGGVCVREISSQFTHNLYSHVNNYMITRDEVFRHSEPNPVNNRTEEASDRSQLSVATVFVLSACPSTVTVSAADTSPSLSSPLSLSPLTAEDAVCAGSPHTPFKRSRTPLTHASGP